ncbi:RDD family protein [Solilutibacter silvestris]|nr:RDD family protein [Lysobacter silvestris]
MNAPDPLPRPRALLGWRLLCLTYDLFPALALWFLVIIVMLAINRGEAVQNGTWAGWLETLLMFAVTGVYATVSWRRGGQTIGMKPWRVYVDAVSGGPASLRALWLRYAVGCVSLGLAGIGFWWALFDRDRLTWHDRASGTRFVRDVQRDGAAE